jgi:LysR family hca operon transcriptional activator
VVDHEPLIVLMPSDHRLTSREAIHPREFVGEIFIGGSNKATVAARRDRGLSAPLRARHQT